MEGSVAGLHRDHAARTPWPAEYLHICSLPFTELHSYPSPSQRTWSTLISSSLPTRKEALEARQTTYNQGTRLVQLEFVCGACAVT